MKTAVPPPSTPAYRRQTLISAGFALALVVGIISYLVTDYVKEQRRRASFDRQVDEYVKGAFRPRVTAADPNPFEVAPAETTAAESK